MPTESLPQFYNAPVESKNERELKNEITSSTTAQEFDELCKIRQYRKENLSDGTYLLLSAIKKENPQLVERILEVFGKHLLFAIPSPTSSQATTWDPIWESINARKNKHSKESLAVLRILGQMGADFSKVPIYSNGNLQITYPLLFLSKTNDFPAAATLLKGGAKLPPFRKMEQQMTPGPIRTALQAHYKWIRQIERRCYRDLTIDSLHNYLTPPIIDIAISCLQILPKTIKDGQPSYCSIRTIEEEKNNK